MVTKRGVVFHHALVHHETYTINKVSKNVVVLKAYAGMDDTLLAIENLPVDGIVIEALGQGNPPRTLPSLERLLNRGIPVVLVSRCFNGIVQDVYSYEGGGKHLKDMGIVFTYGLNAQKARIKLLVALENTNSHESIQNMFMHEKGAVEVFRQLFISLDAMVCAIASP